MARLPGTGEVVTRIITEYDGKGAAEAKKDIAEVSASTMSWTGFLKGRMGPAMKEFGNHTDAVRALSAEYKQYKATGVASLTAVSEASSSASNHASRLGKEISKIRNASEYATSGVRKFRQVFETMAFGAVIGGVSALTQALLDHFKQSFSTREEMDSLSNSVMSQATAWKLLPDPMKAVTKESVELFNAQLKVLQLTAEQEIPSLEQKLLKLVELRAEAVKNKGVWTEFGEVVGDNSRVIAIYDLEIAKLSKDIKVQQGFLGMHETSVDKATESLLKMKEALTAPEGTNFLTQFFAGDLDLTAPKFELTGVDLGKNFGESFVMGMKTTVENAGDQLDFSSMRDITRFDSYADYVQKYLALTEEKYRRETELDDMALTRNLAITEMRYKFEMQAEQQLLNMKFAAGNQAVAFLYLIGQKSKGAALAALALQKGLAIAQTFISTKAAEMLAQATVPPPAGQVLAASISAWGYANMALIAATGIAEAAIGGGGPSGVGGGGGVGALPIQSPRIVPERLESSSTRPQLVFRVEKIELLDDESIDRLMQKISERATKYDVTLEATGVAQ